MQAVSAGADAILNCCSSVGEVADAAQDIGRYTGIPFSRVAREMNRHAELVDGLVDAFGADQDKFKALLCAKADEIADQVDVILLAQGSMAYAEEAIHEKIGKPVLSSPRFGALVLAKALQAKGM